MCIVVVPRCVVGMAGAVDDEQPARRTAGAVSTVSATGVAGEAIHVSVVCIGAAEHA